MTVTIRPEAPPRVAADRVERIESLDVLRGFALLGMLVVHFHDHSLEPGGFDDTIRTAIWRLVEGKSHGTFALLFGAGFAIQLRLSESRGAPFVRIYLRRILGLALFGFVAHACFGFNVLLGYAAWALPLLLIRRWSTRALVAVALASAISVGLYHVLLSEYGNLTQGADATLAAARADRAHAIEVNGALATARAQSSYQELFAARLQHMAWFYSQPFFFMPGVTLALFILGVLGVRHRVFEEPRQHFRLIVGMIAFGIVAWAIDDWLLPLWTTPVGSPVVSRQVHQLFGLLRDQWLTFAYVGGALLLLARSPSWLKRLHPVGQTGRMALTNYLVQIAILDLLFSGYALHLGEIRPRFGPLAAGLIFSLQMAASVWWLSRFRFGPAEWTWRSLTYGRLQPMRR